VRGAAVTSMTAAASGLLALLVAASSARPEEPAAKAGASASAWRVIVGPSLAVPSFDTPYVSRYSPPFQYVEHTSEATQTMPLDAGTGPGMLLGIEHTLGRHVGLQLSAHYGEADITGAPGQYDLSMRYTSRPPPSYEPVEVSLQRSEAQPAAEGRLKTLAVALDLVAWADLGSRGRLGVCAGPAWLRTKGRAQSLVYTAYHMGGHSTSFYQDYLVSFDFPENALGLDLGGFVEVDLGHRVGLRLDLRYVWGPERDADVTLGEIVNPDEIVWSADLADIQAGLAPVPVRVDPSFFRAALALTFRF
jgi:hypothetical protein